MSDHKAFETSIQEKLVAESGHSKNVEEEKEVLRGQVAELRKVCGFSSVQFIYSHNTLRNTA